MYILFGAGVFGSQLSKMIGEDDVIYFVDNDVKKRNLSAIVPVYTFNEKVDELKASQHTIVIAVSSKFEGELAHQLQTHGIINYKTYYQIQMEIIRNKIANRSLCIEIYYKAIEWIKKHSYKAAGIESYTASHQPYPEVTGYFIPTLLRYGYRQYAIAYARWLCSIQKTDGSWYDSQDVAPYVFDSAQILKGLIAIRDILPEVDDYIWNGCDWILSNMKENGRLTTPTENAWGNPKICSEIIHIYCLSPLVDAGRIFGEEKYEKAAQKILHYYLNNHRVEIENFSLLSHFYAYVMEGLIDMGREDVALSAMEKLSVFQKEDGSVPGYTNVNWICSTGLFQLALVWFRLGDIERGNRAFSYACKLQNESGGWYGSYIHPDYPTEKNNYFPNAEISWAVKYFLDALYWKNIAEFNNMSDSFLPAISKDDGRYVLVRGIINDASQEGAKSLEILDVGCGKGRYLSNLAEDFPMHRYYAVDLSEKVMASIPLQHIEKRQGSLTSIPYSDQRFDIVYACEALEHAIDIESAIREMARVIKPGGRIIIVDKSKTKLGVMEIEEWEQWFDEEELKALMQQSCTEVEEISDVPYEDNRIRGLFSAWIGTVI